MIMDETEYLKARLDDQINWYDRKSSLHQKQFKRSQSIQIISAALIPVLAAFADKSIPIQGFDVPLIKIVIGLLGALIAVVSGLLGLYKHQENWVEYRATCEMLQHEKFLFLTRTEPYLGADAFPLLVSRVESIMAKERSTWTEQMKKSRSAEGGKSERSSAKKDAESGNS